MLVKMIVAGIAAFGLAVVVTMPAHSAPSPRQPAPIGIGYALPNTEGEAPGMPAELRRKAQRSWRLFRGERQLNGAARSCRVRTAWNGYEYASEFGYPVYWRYLQQVYFCRLLKSGVVTYFYRVRWHEVYSILPGPLPEWKPWEFKGHTGTNCQNEYCFARGLRAKQRTAWTQGHFKVCLVASILLCNNVSPIVGITVHGNGPINKWSRGG